MPDSTKYPVLSDGNCAFNAFFVSLYYLVLAKKVDLTKNGFFTRFIDDFIEKTKITTIVQPLPAQAKFIRVMQALQKQNAATSYLAVAQRYAAPLLRTIAVEQQHKAELHNQKADTSTCTLLESCLIDAIAEQILASLEVTEVTDQQNPNDQFVGMDVLNQFTSIYEPKFKAELTYNKNNVYNKQSIVNWLHDQHHINIINLWRSQGINLYFAQLKNTSCPVAVNTLLPLANAFNVGFVYREGTRVHNITSKPETESVSLIYTPGHWDVHHLQPKTKAKPQFHFIKNLIHQHHFHHKAVATLAREIAEAAAQDSFYQLATDADAQEKADYKLAKKLQLQELEDFAKACSSKVNISKAGG